MTTANRETTQQIKEMLQARIDTLVRELAPGGDHAWKGKYWMPLNPVRSDSRPGSFWISTRGEKIGAWADEATGDGAAQSRNRRFPGDVFGLIQYVHGFPDFKQSIAWARDWLGLERLPDADRAALARDAAARARQVAAEVQQRQGDGLEERRKAATAAWLGASPTLIGTPVDSYLRSRAIDLRQLPRLPGALRFAAMGRHTETRTLWPVMIACMTGTDANGREAIHAVHRTFLAVDGKGKAPVTPARKIWPSFSGASIRIWRGSSNMSVAEAAANGLREPLVICEGVEDGLSLALAAPEHRIWCAGTLGNIGHIVLPECIDEVIVCADNDWAKPQAEQMLRRGVDALAAQGRKVSIARSHVGKDANDALRGTTA